MSSPKVVCAESLESRINFDTGTLAQIDLGSLHGRQVQSGTVDVYTSVEYSFVAEADGTVSLSLAEQSQSGAELRIGNADGVIDIGDSLNVSVYKGTGYTITVDAADLSAPPSDFELNISADYAGNSPDDARNLGTKPTRTLHDCTGADDTSDYYQFKVTSTAPFTADLTGLSDDADLFLINDNQQTLESSTAFGPASEHVSRSLAAGSYYLVVTGAETNYQLKVATGSVTTTPPAFAKISSRTLTIKGTSGDDIIAVGLNGQTLFASLNGQTLSFSQTAIDQISVTADAGNDSVTVNDDIYTPVFADGGSGKDQVTGGRGPDTLYGGTQADLLVGGGGRDRLVGAGGNDQLLGGAGADALYGGDGEDVLNGGSSSDRIAGDAGNDLIAGSNGNDSIQGGAGADTLNGGNGSDAVDADTLDTTARIEAYLLSTSSAKPTDIIDLGAYGLGSKRITQVTFTSKSEGYSITVPALSANPLRVSVPALLSSRTGLPIEGDVSIAVTRPDNSSFSIAGSLHIATLPLAASGGSLTLQFLRAFDSLYREAKTQATAIAATDAAKAKIAKELNSSIKLNRSVINALKLFRKSGTGEIEIGSLRSTGQSVRLSRSTLYVTDAYFRSVLSSSAATATYEDVDEEIHDFLNLPSILRREALDAGKKAMTMSGLGMAIVGGVAVAAGASPAILAGMAALRLGALIWAPVANAVSLKMAADVIEDKSSVNLVKEYQPELTYALGNTMNYFVNQTRNDVLRTTLKSDLAVVQANLAENITQWANLSGNKPVDKVWHSQTEIPSSIDFHTGEVKYNADPESPPTSTPETPTGPEVPTTPPVLPPSGGGGGGSTVPTPPAVPYVATWSHDNGRFSDVNPSGTYSPRDGELNLYFEDDANKKMTIIVRGTISGSGTASKPYVNLWWNGYYDSSKTYTPEAFATVSVTSMTPSGTDYMIVAGTFRALATNVDANPRGISVQGTFSARVRLS